MSTQTAPGAGGAETPAAPQPISLHRDIQGRVRTCRPARTDREPEDPTAQEWHIILGED
ncbi:MULTISPECIES: hypothetical protein [Streptomyces]|jgi:hypothetical protein|uniref:Uncharacterized protein n=2 Tax=Streptomyces TaxID=1883 RepID=A0A1D8G3I1_9ACTN|nr:MULTISPECIES: hypothetical protein [Streptomyces]AOT59993.1 hypothetical protein A4G23_02855 [Streptomyces rubrolavendulae]KAF0651948.1 hypothetical protein K701_00840 [Streptomyces fradiae ATCC 10745 = DSM 40063]OSY53962.1 hypothetical protein BG846_00379 [Streptomyces fradiae ATCC 10745 = DSM 40063]UQS31582.1 hypothetical protein J5J01_08125 [Streptomyces fradiae]